MPSVAGRRYSERRGVIKKPTAYFTLQYGNMKPKIVNSDCIFHGYQFKIYCVIARRRRNGMKGVFGRSKGRQAGTALLPGTAFG